ncbi:hypothetical protein A2U01_0018984, partial [Trifolium medium]|nr:hypothetical protein [Trifolium medium]
RFISVCCFVEASHELFSSRPKSVQFVRKGWMRRHSVLTVVVVGVFGNSYARRARLR